MAWMLQLPAHRMQMTNSTSPMATRYRNTISDPELANPDKRKQLQRAVVQRLAEEHYQVVFRFFGDQFNRVMATRRAPDEPRVFKNLDRLLTHVAVNYPHLREVTIEQLAPSVETVKLKDYRQ